MSKRANQKCEICGALHARIRFCSNVCKFAWQQRDKPTKEWLYQKYVVEGLDCPAIAKIVNRDTKRVWEWLKNLNIPTRSRGNGNGSLKTRRKRGDAGTFTGKTHSPESREKIRQARLRDGCVPYLKDGKPWMKGRAGPLSTNWKGGLTPERQRIMMTLEWKKAVKKVWKRDKATCQRCQKKLADLREQNKQAKLHMHHIVNFADDPSSKMSCNPNNLVLLCSPCHKWVHSRKNVNSLFIHKIGYIQRELFLPCDFLSKKNFVASERTTP